ncbi:hypothetical protein SpAn4DRAFT_4768 [Sporomusa ovata]|uniref:Uncharacterized protein n=1 Tax=Sporomusa ovata TaxID=2378 RepID=A0A0U1KY76_9FIRM|nr:hypothetical protein SpAn4DRAFT_4768 [Sporomusa ovata]
MRDTPILFYSLFFISKQATEAYFLNLEDKKCKHYFKKYQAQINGQ